MTKTINAQYLHIDLHPLNESALFNWLLASFPMGKPIHAARVLF
ncbi:hypothetical protein [Pseudomonas glycinae]|nr:hypothetical protein [Pseudomonas glycinae]